MRSEHPDFDPIDPEDERFFGQFTTLRQAMVEAASGFRDRVRDRVAGAQRPRTAVADVVFGGLIELFNTVARTLGTDDDEEVP